MLSACAHSQTPPPATVQPPPAHQADAPPPQPEPAAPAAPASARLQVTPRPGWVSLPASMVPDGMVGVLANPSAHGMILIMADSPATLSAHQAADALRTQLAAPPNAWTCSPIATTPDGNSASFTVSQGPQRGKLTIRRMHENPAVNVVFMGRWPDAGNAAMRADFDATVTGATMQ